jgi:hypothetical protein
MSHPALDKFGRILMVEVRDAAIEEFRADVNGQGKSKRAQEIARLVSRAGPKARAVLLDLLPEIVDKTLHYLLWMLEQKGLAQRPEIEVQMRVGNKVVRNIAALSDGLCGELYTEDGWIARFSKEPPHPS